MLLNTTDSIQHYSFIRTKFNSFKYFHETLTIHFNMSRLFAYNKMVKLFYLTHWWDSNWYFYFRSQWSNGNEGVLRIPQSSRTGDTPSDDLTPYSGYSFKRRSYCSAEIQSGVFNSPKRLEMNIYTHIFMGSSQMIVEGNDMFSFVDITILLLQ